MKKIYTTILTVLLLASACRGQDPHFTQFYLSPLLLNPATTGFMDDDVRLVANYRSQWGSISTPFVTMSASVDFSLLQHLVGGNKLGVGLVILNDKAGTSAMRSTSLQSSVAYAKNLGGHFFSIGGRFGVVQQRVDLSKLTFDSQYDGDSFNAYLSSQENINKDNIWYFDASAGVAWGYISKGGHSFYAGAAVDHLNEANTSFMGDALERLYRKYTVYGGAEVNINGMFALVCRAVHLEQGPAKETSLEGLAKVNAALWSDASNQYIYFGALVRKDDAAALVMRYELGHYGLAFSYDLNTSKLAKASAMRGGFELGLAYKQRNSSPANNKPIGCPVF
jgi:type IX secretion system PorP/SprF family membrane protein